jgi:3-dehydroquinate dehydratase/shikimate dehydrogenase
MIVVSITGPSLAQARRQMAESEPYADVFELRLDLIGSRQADTLIRATRQLVIATCRRTHEGGNFHGNVRELLARLLHAASNGAAFVDVDLSAAAIIPAFREAHPGIGLILSYHHRGSRLPDVARLYRRMRDVDADILKFAYMASDAADIALAREFLKYAHRDKRKALAIAMGEFGEASRVLYRRFGSWATYAAPEGGPNAAPGQIPAKLLDRLYRVRRINSSTKIFGVIGNPLTQSRGIFLHNPLFKMYGVNAVYCRFPVVDVAAFMERCAPMLSGFSVTIPHKQTVMQFLDEVDPTAKAIGAVNTVVRKRGKWYGTNTDAAGALDAMEKAGRVEGKRLLVLGAGGAARAIAYEAKRRGAEVLITNRNELKARRLAREFGLTFVPQRQVHDVSFDILANATSVGMMPKVSASPIPKSLLKNKIVFDAVYNPPMTKLLRDARSVGARIVQGTEMYLNQAALQFQMYTGVKPPVAVMRRVLGREW